MYELTFQGATALLNAEGCTLQNLELPVIPKLGLARVSTFYTLNPKLRDCKIACPTAQLEKLLNKKGPKSILEFLENPCAFS